MQAGDDPCPDAEPVHGIYVVQRGWHTGVIVATADWPNRDWMPLDDFPDAKYLEFGWGDERYYKAENPSIWIGLRAALWPTSSIMHVIGLQEATAERAQADEIVRVHVSTCQLRRLAEAIEHEFTRDHPVADGRRLEAFTSPNEFYAAKRSFFFPRMCNWWTAKRLQEAGCPLWPGTVVTARRVMREARQCDTASAAAPE